MALPPGLEGFETALNSNALRERQQIGALSSLIQAQGALRQQALEQNFRSELEAAGPDASQETKLKIASKYMAPGALGALIQGEESKKQQIAATKEMALARIQQGNIQNLFMQNLKAEQERRMGAAAADRIPGFQPQPVAPMGIPPQNPLVSPTLTPSQINSIPFNNAPPTTGANRAAQGMAFDAQTAATGIPTPKVVQGSTASMPQFTGSPQEIRAAQNKWRLQNAKQGGSTTGDFNLTGEEFLATVPAQDRTFIKKLAAYEIDPKTLSTRGGSREMALKQAAQYDPTFDQKNYNTISQAVTRFATGPQGNTVRSLNVAIEHMDTARKLGTALQNGNIPLFNTVANEFATQTGKPAPTNFNAVKEIVADEVVKGVIGGAGALEDRREAAAKIRAASSPAQLNGVLNSWTELLGGQLKGLEKQYEGSTQRKDFRQKYVTPRALQAIEGGSANAYSDADKERRYQEWKARQK